MHVSKFAKRDGNEHIQMWSVSTLSILTKLNPNFICENWSMERLMPTGAQTFCNHPLLHMRLWLSLLCEEYCNVYVAGGKEGEGLAGTHFQNRWATLSKTRDIVMRWWMCVNIQGITNAIYRNLNRVMPKIFLLLYPRRKGNSLHTFVGLLSICRFYHWLSCWSW